MGAARTTTHHQGRLDRAEVWLSRQRRCRVRVGSGATRARLEGARSGEETQSQSRKENGPQAARGVEGQLGSARRAEAYDRALVAAAIDSGYHNFIHDPSRIPTQWQEVSLS